MCGAIYLHPPLSGPPPPYPSPIPPPFPPPLPPIGHFCDRWRKFARRQAAPCCGQAKMHDCARAGGGARCSVVYRYVCRRAGLTLRIYNEKRGGQKVSATIYVHHFNYLLSKLQSNALLHPPIHTVQPHLHCKLLQIIGNLVHKMKRILCTVYNVLQVCTDTVHCTVQYIYIECMHNSYPPYCYCICQNI